MSLCFKTRKCSFSRENIHFGASAESEGPLVYLLPHPPFPANHTTQATCSGKCRQPIRSLE